MIDDDIDFVPLLLKTSELYVNAGIVCGDDPLKSKIVPDCEYVTASAVGANDPAMCIESAAKVMVLLPRVPEIDRLL